MLKKSYLPQAQTWICLAVSVGLLVSTAAARAYEGVVSQTIDGASAALKNGEFQQAKDLFVSSLKEVNKSDKGGTTVWKIWKGIGEAEMGLGDYKKAVASLSKSLQLASKQSADTPDVASVLDSLAWARQASGDTKQAMEDARRAAEIRTAKLPDTSPDLADSLEHLGYLYETSKIWQTAKDYYSKAAAIRAKSAEGSMLQADVIERLAYATFMSGKQDQAEQYYRQALAIKESRDEVHKQYCPGALEDRTVFRSLQGAPNCQRGIRDGNPIEKISANGVTVEASLSPQKDEFSNTVEAHLRFSNQTNAPVQILGNTSSVLTLKPAIKRLHALETRDLAAKVEKKGESKARMIRFFGENATTPVTTTVWGYGPPSFGYLPYGGAPPVVWNGRGRNWGNQQTITTNVPDYQAREEARRRAAEAVEKSSRKADDLRQNALANMTLAPGEAIEGVLEFEPAKFTEALLRVPVGNAVFEFLFD